MSRIAILDMPKYRIYPFGRPVIWQRFFKRTFEEFFGSSSKAFQSPAFLSSSRFAANWATIFSLLRCLAFIDVLAIIVYPFLVELFFCVFERHSQFFQQFICLFICVGSC